MKAVIYSRGVELRVANSMEELREHLRAGGFFQVQLEDGVIALVNAEQVYAIRGA
jgi:hypothetical protein